MSMKRQKGFSGLGALAVLLVFGALSIMGIKAVPYYLNDYAIGKILAALDEHPDISSAGVSDVETLLQKELQANHIELEDDEVDVFRARGKSVTAEISYERRFHLFYNIDVVLIFEHDWNTESQ